MPDDVKNSWEARADAFSLYGFTDLPTVRDRGAVGFAEMPPCGFHEGQARQPHLDELEQARRRLAPQNAGLASSIVGFSQQIFGAICVQWIGTYPVDTPVPMLTFCAIASVFALVVLRAFMQRKL